MDTYGTDRLAVKDVESAIVAKIVEDFNLTPILAKAHYDQMVGYFSEYGRVPTQSGEFCYLAVAATEPAGKPLRTCQMVEVCLELTDPSDLVVLRERGLAGMRRCRIARLVRQARIQGALLTVEDLAFIMTSSTATIKRDIAWLRDSGEQVPTRGQIRDIGPGVSHKAKIVQLWLWGYQFTDIELRTGHSETSIMRYLQDFKQVAALYARHASTPEIRVATGRSSRVISEYVALYERAKHEFPAAPRLRDLLDPAKAKKGANL